MTINISCFDPFKIAASGQCFRMKATDENKVTAFAGDQYVTITALGGGAFDFDCSGEEYQCFWKPYFDLDADYAAIETGALEADDTLACAAATCRGLRILRQEPWEALVSFIVSQRRSIKSIQTCVERLCEHFGDECERGGRRYFAFPAPLALAEADEQDIRACGVGYRAPYIADAARRVLTGALPLDEMRALPNDELMARLMEVKGVGVKVASCAMLFGYHRMDVSPVDVWISRVIAESYGGVSPFEAYGENAGVYQQYLFFSKVKPEGF